MKRAWIRLVFVLSTLVTLLYVGVGVGSLLSNQGKAYPYALQAPEGMAIFFGLLIFSAAAIVALHVSSFIFSGDTDHLECMIVWIVPQLLVFTYAFIMGDPVDDGWKTAFAVHCNGFSAIVLGFGTLGHVAANVYGDYYAKLMK